MGAGPAGAHDVLPEVSAGLQTQGGGGAGSSPAGGLSSVGTLGVPGSLGTQVPKAQSPCPMCWSRHVSVHSWLPEADLGLQQSAAAGPHQLQASLAVSSCLGGAGSGQPPRPVVPRASSPCSPHLSHFIPLLAPPVACHWCHGYPHSSRHAGQGGSNPRVQLLPPWTIPGTTVSGQLPGEQVEMGFLFRAGAAVTAGVVGHTGGCLLVVRDMPASFTTSRSNLCCIFKFWCSICSGRLCYRIHSLYLNRCFGEAWF